MQGLEFEWNIGRFEKSILHQPRELRSVRWTRKRQ